MGSPSEIERTSNICGSCGAYSGEQCRNEKMGRNCVSSYFHPMGFPPEAKDGPHVKLTKDKNAVTRPHDNTDYQAWGNFPKPGEVVPVTPAEMKEILEKPLTYAPSDNPYAAIRQYIHDTILTGPALTGGASDYYRVSIVSPTTPGTDPYIAECNDIIEALQMNFAEGNAFKALWRLGADRVGQGKPGTTRKYDAEKVAFFGERLVAQEEDFNE